MRCCCINISTTCFKNRSDDPLFHIRKHVLQACYILLVNGPLLGLLWWLLTSWYWLPRTIPSWINHLCSWNHWLRYHHDGHAGVDHCLWRGCRYILHRQRRSHSFESTNVTKISRCRVNTTSRLGNQTVRDFFWFYFSSIFLWKKPGATFIVVGWHPRSPALVGEFTQQDDRKKRTAKCLWVTNVTGLLLKCLSWSSLSIKVYGLYENIWFKESEIWWKVISNKIIVMLVTQGLPSSFLSRPNDSLWERWKAWALIMSISMDLLEQATCIICL